MSTTTTPESHLAEVIASFDPSSDERLVTILRSAAKHLHAFVLETSLTREEWEAGINFLTSTGQRCDEQRQEFILLSDTMGVSMLVEMVNQHSSDAATEPTVLGPFYVAGAPAKEMGDSIATDQGGTPLTVSGVVRSANGTPLEGATLEVWQTAPNGLYGARDTLLEPMSYRGTFTTGANGNYVIRTTRPSDYQIPTDGPVGRMLARTGRSAWRPAHVHFLVTCRGYRTLITHLFDAASAYLGVDAVFGVRESLTLDMSTPDAHFDFTLDPLG